VFPRDIDDGNSELTTLKKQSSLPVGDNARRKPADGNLSSDFQSISVIAPMMHYRRTVWRGPQYMDYRISKYRGLELLD
jgi:hypothetical protein